MKLRNRLLLSYVLLVFICLCSFLLGSYTNSVGFNIFSFVLILFCFAIGLIILFFFKTVISSTENLINFSSEKQSELDLILSNINDAVFIVGIDLRVVVVNNVVLKMTGYNLDQIIGSIYSEKLKFRYDETGKINDQFIKKAFETKKNQKMSNRTVLINKYGLKKQVSYSSAPLMNVNNDVIACVVIFHEVTHEREIDKVKTEFVSLASHQLRTPLSAIGWYTEMLLAGDVGKLNKGQTKYLNEVYKGNQRMVDLVNSLLNVSRLELGTFAVEPQLVNIVEISESVVLEMQPIVLKKHLVLNENYTSPLPIISIDPKLTRIIFQNLLSNAVKYTPEKGKIQVGIEMCAKGENMEGLIATVDSLFITVGDSGYGIPDEQQHLIFEKLFRADNVRALDTEGTGLGLYMVKTIIEQTGGKIWFQSIENKGSTFFVQMPISGMKEKKGTKQLT